MTLQVWLWIGFALFVAAMLALDLGVFNRRSHTVRLKEALLWTGIWFGLALLFGLGVGHFEGHQKAVEFYTGYLIELSLSADNVFVFVLIFSFFAVPARFQHTVLFWGVMGALGMRLIMIGLGVSLIQRFSWILYLFGAFLVYTGVKLFLGREQEAHPEKNPVVRWFTRVVPVTPDYVQAHFVVRRPQGLQATPLLVVLLCVETSDVIFAVDSIPAIFAVTLDPFIIYTSNVFAIMGLRSLYFVLSGVIDKFYYLRAGLAGVLSFVGAKMLLAHSAWQIGSITALIVVGGILLAALLASVVRSRCCKDKPKASRSAQVSR